MTILTMTRKEIKRWAEDTFNKIFHHHGKELTRIEGEVIDPVTKSECRVIAKIGSYNISYVYHFENCGLKPGDEVEIILRKK